MFLYFQNGDLQASYMSVQKSLKAYPTHRESQVLFEKLEKYFTYM